MRDSRRFVHWQSVGALAIALTAAAPWPGWAIDPGWTLERLHRRSWTDRDGAPTQVEAMAQSEDGFLWLGTSNGVVRFDGVQFVHYVPRTGEWLRREPVTALLALPGNALLIGWMHGGVTLLRDGRTTHFREQDGYPSGTTTQFVRDRDGNVWAGTSSGLGRYDGTRWEKIGSDWNFPEKPVIALFVDRDGTVGAFTEATLLLRAPGAKTFRATGGTWAGRTSIVQASGGTYFVSVPKSIRSFAKLDRYDKDDAPVVDRMKPDDLRELLVDRDGGLWFTTETGIGRIARPERKDARVEYYKVDELFQGDHNLLLEDREGSIWVASARGIDRFRGTTFAPPTGALKSSYPAMAADADGGLWFGAIGGSLFQAPAQGAIRLVKPLQVTCAHRDLRGNLWFASQRDVSTVAELFRYEGGRFESIALPPAISPGFDVQAIGREKTGALWISVVRNGVYRRDADKWSQPAGLPDAGKSVALVMVADSADRMWLGYMGNRLARYGSGEVRLYGADDGLDVGNVTALHERNGRVWIGGERGVAFVEGDRIRLLMTMEPDAFAGITGIVETREGDLWLHGMSGAARIAAAEVRKVLADPAYRASVRMFGDDGLSGLPTFIRPLPTLVEGAKGRLWFGTRQGVFALDPAAIPPSGRPPSVVIDSLVSGDQRFSVPSAVELLPLSTVLEVDYAAAGVASPRSARFRYRLDGVDEDWQEAGTRRQARYTNLRPGSYRFEVVSANDDGVWDTTGASLDVAIVPAWYQTRWFAMLCVVAALALVVILYRARVRQVRSQLQARLQERLLERERIARELHDTLIQGFQGLVLTFAAAIRRIGPGDARAEMERAVKRAQATLAEGRDRVRDLRDSVAFHGDLPKALADVAADLELAHHAVFSLSVRGTRREMQALVVDEIYLIAREALANAYRHANAQHIDVEVEFGDSRFLVRVRDDGKGVPAEVIESGVAGHWGMIGMRERAQKVGSRLRVRSGPGSGTEVELEVPADAAYRDEVERKWKFTGDGQDRTGAANDG